MRETGQKLTDEALAHMREAGQVLHTVVLRWILSILARSATTDVVDRQPRYFLLRQKMLRSPGRSRITRCSATIMCKQPDVLFSLCHHRLPPWSFRSLQEFCTWSMMGLEWIRQARLPQLFGTVRRHYPAFLLPFQCGRETRSGGGTKMRRTVIS